MHPQHPYSDMSTALFRPIIEENVDRTDRSNRVLRTEMQETSQGNHLATPIGQPAEDPMKYILEKHSKPYVVLGLV